ncbi:hypothetical protein GGTG_07629 [Gaeumannomyces tritici R3-111a-1]|uniref:Uncharacterized protein n=1 Tax=Gaeumannomyces tritici (strain R3-111a-1) TaxID=644352 RepID=J3P281_GAET3|nr:hypothetical protein GGTG_07629 [Gaeumannomyces tritici R3-111a-1]EJT73773.1 hypothetical protein GGTG_07629 [Gaeumannomyces tritici R3-111a-1]
MPPGRLSAQLRFYGIPFTSKHTRSDLFGALEAAHKARKVGDVTNKAIGHRVTSGV